MENMHIDVSEWRVKEWGMYIIKCTVAVILLINIWFKYRTIDIIIFALFSFIFGMKRSYETCMKSG